MKLGPVTKADKRNKTTSKKTDDNIMSKNYSVITIFPIYDQFGAIRKPGSKLTYLLIVIFSLTKTESRTKKSQTQLSHHRYE